VRRLALVLSLSAGLLLALAATAQARPPLHDSSTNSFSASAPCDGFLDVYSATSHVRTTIFFDRGGNAVMERDKVMTRETDVNSVTGKTVLVKQSFSFLLDLNTFQATWNGQVYMGIGGHDAHAIHDTGKVVVDENGDLIKLAGPHSVYFGGDEPFCEALS
jgi:hypothetical protein